MSLDVFLFASWIGGVAFALSGFLIGVRKELDLMGVFTLSFLTANGGGVLRDVLIGRTPYALTDMTGFIIVVLMFGVGYLLCRFKYSTLERRSLFVLSDSIGLVAFSITGAIAGIDAGLSVFGVMLLSFITATGGGVLRDILVNEVPAVFKSDFYGSIAILVALVLYGLDVMEMSSEVNFLIVFAVFLVMRLVAYKMRWHLPRLKF
ncbi:MAG: trimeric intracellular cation channel family protein [Alphaproteobacteria bacterium]|nr:trimeric intracellular cation channel family protein [Alphaproteobacteria bacterium]